MTEWILSLKKPRGNDSSAAILRDGDLAFAIEEERLTRQKHAVDSFPKNAIEACLKYCDLELEDVDKVVYPDIPRLRGKTFKHQLYEAMRPESHLLKLSEIENVLERQLQSRLTSSTELWTEKYMNQIGSIENINIEMYSHHKCHAASVLFMEEFNKQGIIVTIDGKGEYDSTVIWETDGESLERVKTYEYPNSLGIFYGIVTEFLGYIHKNGEGKVMGLAPYGSQNINIESSLRDYITIGHDYDVTPLTRGGLDAGIKRLENEFQRPRETNPGDFSEWQKDLAYVTQKLLEEIVTDIIEEYTDELNASTVGLTGGVALNCKMNKKIMELDGVNDLIIQPIAHDGGLAIGGGVLGSTSTKMDMNSVYYGPSYSTDEITSILDENKIDYEIIDNIESLIAEELTNDKLVGWFQGRTEMGPRALGNRSILADPRTKESRNRVNEFVKHREQWRPFAPSILEDSVDEYLVNGQSAPYMIRTFDVKEDKKSDISAVLHPADETTRPQTVMKKENPRYYRLLSEFEELTGIPVILNTSFNDSGEPIVNTPTEAIKDFYAMGLDILVIENVLIKK